MPPKTPPARGVTPPPPKKGKGLTFPPLVKQWTCKSEASWPGAEYTRRTRLKTQLEYNFSNEFIEDLKETLGKNYGEFETAMAPAVDRKLTRGAPATEKGHRPIQPQYVLPRTEDEAGGKDDDHPLMGSTRGLSGLISKTKIPEISYTKDGPVPEYMFEDREKMTSLAEWFDKYGKPTPNAINLGPRQLYTHYDKSTRRCCGEESHVTRMHKGFLTA